MGYRGSKSVWHKNLTVKEQRVDGSSIFKNIVRCTLAPKETWYLDK